MGLRRLVQRIRGYFARKRAARDRARAYAQKYGIPYSQAKWYLKKHPDAE
ncbi:MAG: hypothetical protein V1493_02715 [Candidatus Diapherotrites archaeon]